MSQFSRRARWLNFLFPASVAPQLTDPGTVSEDVSLTQPYDGGGFSLADVDWFHFITGPAGAIGSFVVFTIPPGFMFRWMAADGQTLAGVTPQGLFRITATSGGPSSGEIRATDQVVIPTGGIIMPLREIRMVPPSSNINFFYNGGDAATIVIARIYGALVPVGTVFYV